MSERSTNKVSEGKASFGAHLRRLRQDAGLTQEELASRSGLSPNAVSALERGARKRPYPHTVRSLADALELSVEERTSLFEAVPNPGKATLSEASTLMTTPTLGLPNPATPLLGRERELEELAHLIGDGNARLLTLTGIGGVGKTRLAVEVVREALELFPDGAAFVELAPLVNPAFVTSAILRSLGFSEVTGLSPGESLAAHLREKRLLLVLDNFEHLLDAAAEVASLVEACPQLTVLTTSRAPLRIRGEQEYPVSPLDLPSSSRSPDKDELLTAPSGQLFMDRARAVYPGFRLTEENAGAVAAICWRLAGLPLALELAAAKVRFLEPQALLTRLDGALSAAWTRDLPQRQRTMQSTLDWSYELLSEQERSLFRRLSVFAGGFSLEAAEAVGAADEGDSEDVLELLGSLVEQSLVFAEAAGVGVTRYRMLEPVRQYALQRLEESGEAEEARRRHATFFLALAKAAEPELKGSKQVEWLNNLEREHDNLRAALSWLLERDEIESVAHFVYSLYVFWWIRSLHTEGRRWTEATLASESYLSLGGRARVLFVCGAMTMGQGDHSAAEAYYSESYGLFEATRDVYGGTRPRLGLGLLAMSHADAQRAAQYLQESAEAASEVGDHFWSALSLSALGMVSLGQGRYEEAQASLAEGLVLAKRAGDRFSRYIALYNRSVLAQAQGDHDRATALFEEGLAFSLEAGDYANIAYCLEGLAAVAVAQDKADRSALLLGAAQRLREEVGTAVYTYRPDHSLQERAATSVRSRLDEEHFEQARAKGRSMTFEQALAYALESDEADKASPI